MSKNSEKIQKSEKNRKTVSSFLGRVKAFTQDPKHKDKITRVKNRKIGEKD